MEIGTLGWAGPKLEPVFRGGTGINGSAAPNGSLPIGNGSGFTLATLTGTANQVVVTNTSGVITLATPQDINTGSSPTFSILNLSAASNQIVLNTNGTLSWAPSITRLITFPDISGTVITTGNLSSITTTGTIGTGVWHGTVIGTLYGGTGLDSSNAANGTLLIGNGTGFTLATLTGTSNQVNVGNTSGVITLSLPQSIDTGAGPSFASLNLTAASNQLIIDTNGTLSWTPTIARLITFPDISGTVITTGNLTSITTTGTIGTGVWHGTAIGTLYGGTGLDSSTAAFGTLLIGNGSGLSLATLSAGSGISVTNASGSITIAASGSTSAGLYNYNNFS